MGEGTEGKVRSHEPSEWIERLRVGDVNAVRTVALVSFSEAWRESDFVYFLEHHCGFCFGLWQGAPKDRRLAAYCLALLVQGDLDIVSVATLPEARREGVAARLVTFVLRQLEVKRAFLEVDAENAPAIGLYSKLGFTPTGKRKGYYGGTRDALLMARGAGSKPLP